MKKHKNSTLTEYQGREEILGFEFDLINKEYEPIDIHNLSGKLNVKNIESKFYYVYDLELALERTICMFLKNELFFLTGKWLKSYSN